MNRRHLIASCACAALVTTSVAQAENPDSDPLEPGERILHGSVEPPPVTISPKQVAAGKKAFGSVHEVLLSPRCSNCHPAGNAPLQTDAGVPHAMNITRESEKNGLACATCHSPTNATDAVGAPLGSPPGAPNWHLPPEDTPMVFVGRTPAQLCAQLKDPARNGEKTLAQLVEHVTHDPLVLWGWNPGVGRTKPPIEHAAFVAAFETWVDAGAPCPD